MASVKSRNGPPSDGACMKRPKGTIEEPLGAFVAKLEDVGDEGVVGEEESDLFPKCFGRVSDM